MSIQRRDFLKAGVAISMLSVVPRSVRANGTFAPRPSAWRRFELRTGVEIKEPAGMTRAWIDNDDRVVGGDEPGACPVPEQDRAKVEHIGREQE